MSNVLEQRVESLLEDLDQVAMSPAPENQTCRSEILEEILRLVALSLEAKQRAENIAKYGRWV
jgi:hypothetical protein